MLFSHRNVAVFALLLIFLIVWFKPIPLHTKSALHYLRASGPASPDILNATLGFQQVFVINIPERTDRRDAMTLAAALSRIDVQWIDGVDGHSVSDKVVPGDSWDKSISKGNKGSWRAHMNVLQRVVQDNITSALILEDDADWDVRIKPQLQVFAQAARAFTQSVPQHHPEHGVSYADHTSQSEISLAQLPPKLRLSVTPYGDAWDVLWLGHCGTELPKESDMVSDHGYDVKSSKPPVLKITIPNDATVPSPKHLKAHPFALQDEIAKQYPPHTRIVHSSSKTTCTQAYAVSQQGARKLLWQFGLQTLTTGWDLMLRDWCDGLYKSSSRDGRTANHPVCVTVQPPIFSHHYGKGAASDITAPGGGFVNKEKEMTPYIRLSVRLNMERLVNGASFEDLVDQWEDGT
ncbi:family 25 putative glycosyltransferase [Podospora australis]|uniref:Family 25 putative glycosyltransferase n=1 Tax=Podospora australis TaxID=1536484 RepID=A0AAN6WZE7_9PEZI|nr:family 25 putative glycosyltransferase [Podospora australis]